MDTASKLPRSELTKVKDNILINFSRVHDVCRLIKTSAATKIELLKYKRSKQVAAMVQKILDDKRKVLLKNIEEMITEADKARGGIWIHYRTSTSQ